MGASSNKMIKKKVKEICEITPYNEMNNADVKIDKITDLIQINNEIENKKYKENPYLDTEKKLVQIQDYEKKNVANEQETAVTISKLVTNFDALFSEKEKKYLSKVFLIYSSDGIMSNRQFWSYLNLGHIYSTTFAKLFYKAACDFNDNTKLEYIKFMDEAKFLQLVAILTKVGELQVGKTKVFLAEQKVKFFYSLFDVDGNEEVDKLEFRNIITSFVEMILSCKFECEGFQEKIRTLNQDATNMQLMEKVLDQYVDEVYQAYSYNGEVLTFEEWTKWLDKISGIEQIMNFYREMN